ncbi:hypothetical protein LPJ61_000329 [Coemansia biformis]|uniref:Pentacotripeptide-repeat region of PRORP domain-containing protein n=1 Tax=Coemansia biformis TaxID=1286918 RepID=A0A9W8CZ43_9FUNG|nr:hypothetical protein LPJ61_000329 [Coemansia biformis]
MPALAGLWGLCARYSTTDRPGAPPVGGASGADGPAGETGGSVGQHEDEHADEARGRNGLLEAPNTHRYALYKAIHGFDAEGVWGRFNEMVRGSEWRKVTEYDVCRVLQTFNNQYAYERGPEPLSRAGAVIDICERRGMRLKTAFFYNECIRLYIAKERRDTALAIKRRMDDGQYGPDARTDIYTYAALFSDPHVQSLDDLTQMIEAYDEMIERGIVPNELIQKPLLRAARKVGELRLLSGLLEAREMADAPRMLGTTEARLISNKAQAHLTLDRLRPALEQLHRLLIRPIPKDARPIPGIQTATEGEISIPLEYSRTRQAFFIYLRSLYESIIRIHLARRNAQYAHEMLEDMRRNCYLPPTKLVYHTFVRYYAKRKNIQKLREIHDMMLQDGVPLDEYVYTKFITSCMFAPKRRLLATLTARASKARVPRPRPGPPEAAGVSTSIAGSGEGKPPPRRSGLPGFTDMAASAQSIDRLVYHPHDCIRFFEDMLLDYGVAPNNIRDEGFRPNVHITNSIMRAYLEVERPILALREFFRYRYHQNQQYPNQPPPDVVSSSKAVAHVFRMALDAAKTTGDDRTTQRVYKNMLQWETNLPPEPTGGR